MRYGGKILKMGTSDKMNWQAFGYLDIETAVVEPVTWQGILLNNAEFLRSDTDLYCFSASGQAA